MIELSCGRCREEVERLETRLAESEQARWQMVKTFNETLGRCRERVMNGWERVMNREQDRCEGWLGERDGYWVCVSANGAHEKIVRSREEAMWSLEAWAGDQVFPDAAREGEGGE